MAESQAEKEQMVIKMIAKGLSDADISDYSGLSEQAIANLARSMP